jgi:hypothetical protein
MCHPVMRWLEVAEATNKTGEDTVALFAGVETVTLTHAEANIGSETRHTTTKGDFQRIIRFSPQGGLSQRREITSAGYSYS